MSVSSFNPYSTVLMVGNHYCAIHVTGPTNFQFITNLDSKFKEAQAAAAAFSKLKNIQVVEGFKRLDKPIVSIYKTQGNWYPCEIDSIGLKVLLLRNQPNYDGTKETAKMKAQEYAKDIDSDFLPRLGESIIEAGERKAGEPSSSH